MKSTMDPAWLQKELEKLKEENARLKRDKTNAAEEWKSKLEEERGKIIELRKDNKKLIQKEIERKKKKAEWMERQKGKRDKAVKLWQKSNKRHVVNKKNKIESDSSDSDTDDPPEYGFWYGLGAAIFGDAEYLDKLGLVCFIISSFQYMCIEWLDDLNLKQYVLIRGAPLLIRLPRRI